jgi:hypothetical protein
MSYKKTKRLDYIEDEVDEISHTIARIFSDLEATKRVLVRVNDRVIELEKKLRENKRGGLYGKNGDL